MKKYQSQLTTSLGYNESFFSQMLSIIGGGSRRGAIYKCCCYIIPRRRGLWGILCFWFEQNEEENCVNEGEK